jgi:hypothetical protein
MLPQLAFARLWLNEFSASGGDALTPADVHAAFSESERPMNGSEPGYIFVGGLDLGLVRDFSVFVILAIPDGGMGGKIRLAHHKVWRPVGDGSKLNIGEIENHILEMDSRYRLAYVGFDPWQAEHLSQRLEQMTQHRRRKTEIYQPLRQRGITSWMREVPPTASNLREIAGLVIESFSDRRFMFCPCEPLRRDLLKLRATEKSYGIRLESPHDRDGHGDVFSAFANALLIGHELAGKKKVTAGTTSAGARTPAQRTAAQLAYELAEFERLAHTPEDHQAGWRDALIRAGGARRLGG